jgi:hypothetical protein
MMDGVDGGDWDILRASRRFEYIQMAEKLV